MLRSVLGSRRAVGMIGDLIRAVGWLVAVLVAFVSLTFVLPVSWRLTRSIQFNDFGRFYEATQLFEQGLDMYGPTPATPLRMPRAGIVQLLDLNPPHFHWLLIPLTGLSIQTAFIVWSLTGLGCLALSLALIRRELRCGWSAPGLMWTFLFVVASAASTTTFVTGQLTYFLMLPVTLAWIACRRGAWTRAAILLGVLTSVKLFFGVFTLYFILIRRWRASAWMAIACIVTFGLGLVFFGAAAYVSWTQALLSVAWPWLGMNASLTGLVSRTLGGGPVFAPLVLAPGVARIVAFIASLLLLVVTLRRVAFDTWPGATDRSFLRILLLTVLISPLGWAYYLWIVAGPAVGVWLESRVRAARASRWMLIAAVPGLFVPVSLTVEWADRPWGSATIGSIYTWSTLLLWSAAMLIGPERATPTESSGLAQTNPS